MTSGLSFLENFVIQFKKEVVVTRETLEQLNAFTSEDFKSWLTRRLREKWSSNERTRYYAFDFRHLNIPFGDSHCDDLKRLFIKLHPQTQENLKKAVYLLISEADLEIFSREMMKDLIFIVFKFNNNQTLDDTAKGLLMNTIPDGPWGQEYPSLIYGCASVMTCFDPTTEMVLMEKFVKAGKALKRPEVA